MASLVERTRAAVQAVSGLNPDYADIDAIADEAATMRPATPQEALLQASVLAGEVSLMLDRSDDDALPRMEKLAESLVAYIERTAGIDRRQFGFEYYAGPPQLN